MVAGSGLQIDSNRRQTIKWGGTALVAAAVILFVFIVSIFVSGQAMPPSAEEVL
jgi:hypothetical protein